MYTIRCGVTSNTDWASIYICDIYEGDKIVDQVEFTVYKSRANKPRKIYATRPSSFVEAFEREYGGKDWVDRLARRGGSRTAKSLEWLVSEMIKNGLWTPGTWKNSSKAPITEEKTEKLRGALA